MIKVLIVFLFFITNSKVFGYDIEPYGGLVLGDFDQPYYATGTISGTSTTLLGSDSTSFTGSVFGFSAGVRIGRQFGGFFGAFDPNIENGTYEFFVSNGFNSSYVDIDYFLLSNSIIGGYKLKHFGFWAGYSPIDIVSLTYDNIDNTYTGSSYKFGLSYYNVKYSINVEFSKRTFSGRDGEDFPYTYEDSGLTITERDMTVDTLLISYGRIFKGI